jgi:heme A synthase
MTSTLTRQHPVRERAPRVTSAAYSTLIALATVAIVLQGLWAGLFLEHGSSGTWIDVHARGGEVAIVLVALATVGGFVRLRRRRDLWLGAGVLTALLVLEAYLGGLIHDSGKDSLTAVHVPLAMAIVATTVWLLVRSRRGRA